MVSAVEAETAGYPGLAGQPPSFIAQLQASARQIRRNKVDGPQGTTPEVALWAPRTRMSMPRTGEEQAS